MSTEPPHAKPNGQARIAVAAEELMTQTNAVAQRSSAGTIQR